MHAIDLKVRAVRAALKQAGISVTVEAFPNHGRVSISGAGADVVTVAAMRIAYLLGLAQIDVDIATSAAIPALFGNWVSVIHIGDLEVGADEACRVARRVLGIAG